MTIKEAKNILTKELVDAVNGIPLYDEGSNEEKENKQYIEALDMAIQIIGEKENELSDTDSKIS